MSSLHILCVGDFLSMDGKLLLQLQLARLSKWDLMSLNTEKKLRNYTFNWMTYRVGKMTLTLPLENPWETSMRKMEFAMPTTFLQPTLEQTDRHLQEYQLTWPLSLLKFCTYSLREVQCVPQLEVKTLASAQHQLRTIMELLSTMNKSMCVLVDQLTLWRNWPLLEMFRYLGLTHPDTLRQSGTMC